MKVIGIVGGIGPESTTVYYRQIIARYRELQPDGSYPPILINSIDLTKMLGMIAANELDAVTEYLVSEVARLVQAGAECALLASNTPHIVFEAIAARSPVPLVSIVEATSAAVKSQGFQRVGLFGTRFTMQGQFYPEVFSREGITLITPKANEQTYIHDRYLGELVNNILRPETRDGLLQIANRLYKEEGIAALILGGTELPLILQDGMIAGLPLLDTTQIHVQAIVEYAFSQNS